jgi:hypothetical protein
MGARVGCDSLGRDLMAQKRASNLDPSIRSAYSGKGLVEASRRMGNHCILLRFRNKIARIVGRRVFHQGKTLGVHHTGLASTKSDVRPIRPLGWLTYSPAWRENCICNNPRGRENLGSIHVALQLKDQGIALYLSHHKWKRHRLHPIQSILKFCMGATSPSDHVERSGQPCRSLPGRGSSISVLALLMIA